MSFKDKLQKRIEKNAVKIPNLTYKDSKGREHTEDIVLKKSNLPLIGDWGRIYPPVDENGKTLWLNLIFGGKKNFFKFLVIMVILFLLYNMVTGILGASKEYLDGTKYVIIEKDLFNKYCSVSLPATQGDAPLVMNQSEIDKILEGG